MDWDTCNPDQELERPPPYQDLQDLQDLGDLRDLQAVRAGWDPAFGAGGMSFAAAPASSTLAVVTTVRADWRALQIMVCTALSHVTEICVFVEDSDTWSDATNRASLEIRSFCHGSSTQTSLAAW